jgi:hypothetical protein
MKILRKIKNRKWFQYAFKYFVLLLLLFIQFIVLVIFSYYFTDLTPYVTRFLAFYALTIFLLTYLPIKSKNIRGKEIGWRRFYSIISLLFLVLFGSFVGYINDSQGESGMLFIKCVANSKELSWDPLFNSKLDWIPPCYPGFVFDVTQDELWLHSQPITYQNMIMLGHVN